MKNISAFQIGVYVLCGIGIIAAVLLFSGKIPVGKKGGEATIAGNVTMWGTIPYEAMLTVIDGLRKTYKDVNITYVAKDPAQFQNDLVNALSLGTGPDLITVSLSDIIPNKERLVTVPYENLSQALFKTTFVDQGNLYMTDTGVIAFPLIVDPMVMFYNRDMISSSFTVQPPATWDEVIVLHNKVTRKEDSGVITNSGVALGTFDNITHAKELIALMLFQGGNGIVAFDPEQNKYVSTFANGANTANALNFYTSFANPTDPNNYSWNRTLPNDKTQFIAGKLALYFGYASEVDEIRGRNPNLNFDLAMMPQRGASPIKMTYGHMTGVGVMKMSRNINVAFAVAQALASREGITSLLGSSPFSAPARKDMLAAIPSNAHQSMIYQSAIVSRGFLDPDPIQTTAFFRRSIDQINSGLVRPESLLTSGDSLFTSILNKAQPESQPQ